MTDYKSLYLLLFGAMEDAIEELEQLNVGRAKERLTAAQQEAEERILNGEA